MHVKAKYARTTSPQPLIANAGYESFVLSVALIMLVNSMLLVLPVAVDVRSVAQVMNALLSSFLLLDASVRFMHPAGRMPWLIKRWGWLIVLSSAPAPFASVGRLLVAGLTMHHPHRITLEAMRISIAKKRAQSTLLGVLLVAILVFETAGVLILEAERISPDANILNASDALWWGYATMVTVGYGDRYPVTNYGRLIGVAVMTIGVSLFAVMTSYLTDWFRLLRTAKTRYPPADAPVEDVAALIAAMRQALDDKAQADRLALDELRARLDQLEHRLQ